MDPKSDLELEPEIGVAYRSEQDRGNCRSHLGDKNHRVPG